MITASGSSRLQAEATPVPSASIARSISFSVSLSPSFEGALPNPARQPVALVLPHQLEQVGLGAPLVLAPRPASIAARPA